MKQIHKKLLIIGQLIALVILPLALSGQSQAQTIIAAVGDSITSGYPEVWCSRGRQAYGGYSKYLEPQLDASGWSVTLQNYGIAGDRAKWLALDYNKWCTTETWIHNGALIRHNQINVALARTPLPEYMLMMAGTNDLSFHSAPTVMAYLEYNVEEAILPAGVTPIMATILPDTRSSHAFKDETGLNALIRAYASANDITYAELYYATSVSGWKSMMSDGLHPNNDGRRLMADVWYGALQTARAIKIAAEEAQKRKIAGALQGPLLLLLLTD